RGGVIACERSISIKFVEDTIISHVPVLPEHWIAYTIHIILSEVAKGNCVRHTTHNFSSQLTLLGQQQERVFDKQKTYKPPPLADHHMIRKSAYCTTKTHKTAAISEVEEVAAVNTYKPRQTNTPPSNTNNNTATNNTQRQPKTQIGSNNKKTDHCWICDATDHWAMKCPQKTNDICFRCRTEGVRVYNCSTPSCIEAMSKRMLELGIHQTTIAAYRPQANPTERLPPFATEFPSIHPENWSSCSRGRPRQGQLPPINISRRRQKSALDKLYVKLIYLPAKTRLEHGSRRARVNLLARARRRQL
ncbi:unnamed protein product, partial [Trichogramma brassicae]